MVSTNALASKALWNARDCEVDIAGYSSYDVFENCPIKEVDFGSEVNSVPERAFYTNGGLEIVKTHGTINYVGTEAFKGTTWLGNQERGMVYLDHAAYIYKDAAESDDPIKLDLPEGTRSLSSRALMGNKKLVKVTIPKTLDRIGEMALMVARRLARLSGTLILPVLSRISTMVSKSSCSLRRSQR